MNNLLKLIWPVIALIIVILLLTLFDFENKNYRKINSDRINSVLSDSIKKLIDTFDINSYTENIDSVKNTIEGSIITLDYRFGKVNFNDKLFGLIPESSRTLSASGLDKVCLTRMIETEVGKYQNGTLAIRRDIELNIIDLKNKEIVLKQIFLGNDPPKEIKKRYGNKDNVHGILPNDSLIADFIKSKIK